MAIIFAYSAAGGANNGTSWTDAYTSLNTALAAVAAGDTVLVSGTFNETVTISVAGTVTAPVLVRGDDRSGGAGVGQPAQFTIDGQSTRANCLTTSLASNTNAMYCFRNMTCTGATSHGVSLAAIRHVTYKNCRSHTNGGNGWLCTNSGHSFETCRADGNTAIGIEGNDIVIVGCKIHGNGGNGVLPTAITAFSCLFYNNTGADIECNSTSGQISIFNCTVDGDGKTAEGIRIDGGSHRGHCVVNTAVVGCSGTGSVGIASTSNNIGEVAIMLNNLVNNNTSNYTNTETFTGEVTSAPGFTNQGSDDYTLSSGGAVDAGADASDNTL